MLLFASGVALAVLRIGNDQPNTFHGNEGNDSLDGGPGEDDIDHCQGANTDASGVVLRGRGLRLFCNLRSSVS